MTVKHESCNYKIKVWDWCLGVAVALAIAFCLAVLVTAGASAHDGPAGHTHNDTNFEEPVPKTELTKPDGSKVYVPGTEEHDIWWCNGYTEKGSCYSDTKVSCAWDAAEEVCKPE